MHNYHSEIAPSIQTCQTSSGSSDSATNSEIDFFKIGCKKSPAISSKGMSTKLRLDISGCGIVSLGDWMMALS